MEEVMGILRHVRPDVDFERETRLIEGGVLDSFDIVTIVGELEEAFGIEIDIEDIEPANFDSAAAIAEFVRAR